ncbi:MAG: hypothetical protein KDC54_11830 [Lewinella sp.]|nr:hypothetical protein [Lewinella sp.]
MRSKLQKFTEFASGLLPHETEFLLRSQRFEDDIKLSILECVNANSHRLKDQVDYDQAIDKRKYSHLKNWIVDRLQSVDVDEQFDWMSQLERRIMKDSIDIQEEKALLKYIKQYEGPIFYFAKLYELAEHYRHFLLIRLRYDDHRLVADFLDRYREEYERVRAVNARIHQATSEIVDQFSNNTSDTLQWEQWLTDVFYDETLDGFNRYLALVRLTFLYLNYRQLDRLRDKFDYLDQMFLDGRYYSKRLLLNYYHNRMLLHTKRKEYNEAVYYGYLSIRQKNNDYLLYVNNLSAVLLRQDRTEEALDILREALPDMKASKNFFNRVGYVAFHVSALTRSGKARNAESYAETYLAAYRSEVLKYRWHLFFSAFLQSLLQQEKYAKVMRTVRKYKLLDREKRYQKRANYLPTILWYHALAEYKEGHLTRQQFQQRMLQTMEGMAVDRDRNRLLRDLVSELRSYAPEAMRVVEEMVVAA